MQNKQRRFLSMMHLSLSLQCLVSMMTLSLSLPPGPSIRSVLTRGLRPLDTRSIRSIAAGHSRDPSQD